MKQNIKAIILDIDGTTLNSNHQLTPLTKEVLKKLHTAGIKVVLASARSIHSVLKIANDIGLPPLPMIGGNGAIVASSKNNILYRNSIQKESLSKILPVLKKYLYEKNVHSRVTIHFYSGFEWLVPVYNETVDAEIHAVGFKPDFIGEEVFQKTDIEKIMCVTHSSFVPKLSSEIKSVCPELEIVLSKPYSMEVTAFGVSKLSGLIHYAEHFHLKLSEFIAMGDGDNDAEMLAQCGYGVAMANGSDAAKASAKEVTLSNDEDGVAVFLKNYFNI